LKTKLLIATGNRAKVKEYSELLKGAPYFLTTLADEDIDIDVEETGQTLEENAKLKATAYANISQSLVAADDSGLEVDALGGEPGPLSARYAGENVTDQQRISFLLSRLEGVPWEKRSAQFRCVIAIASPTGNTQLCEGECRGYITFEPKGTQGFGYDPIFYLPQLDKTMAELSMEEKNQVSHRSRAARKAVEFLTNLQTEIGE
jgi:XTP/dITP diphosphohydrolase